MVTDDELGQVRNLQNAAEAIKRKTGFLIAKLAGKLNGQNPGGIDRIVFATTDSSRVVGTVGAMFGGGKIRLAWVHDRAQPQGEIVVDREIFDKFDRTHWEPVLRYFNQFAWRILATATLNS